MAPSGVALTVPQVLHLARLSARPDASVESFLYWSTDRLGRKETLNLTHLTLTRPDDERLPEVVAVARHVFASHYVTGSLSITALTRGGPGAPRYLVYLNRSRLDVLNGSFAGLTRHLIERRIGAEAPAILRALRHRLESGVPPR